MHGATLLRLSSTMNPRISNWTGRRVWVIGASTGIGAETARSLLAAGACVALSARKADALQAIAAGRRDALVLPLDVTQHAEVLAARDALARAWQGVDLVLIVAGAYSEMRVDNFDMQAVDSMLDVNLRGVFHCIDATLPLLLKQAGSGSGIGIVSSVAGYSGLPRALAYGPTKAALINLAESLYFDLHPRGHSVYLINPGFVATQATAGNDFVMPALISAPEAAAHIVRGIERGAFHIHFPRKFTNLLRFARVLPYRWYFWLIHKVTGL
jgi:NAD(P)-dependent dehydrogenase (short-subunit alcohol dehydrogenase family)